MSISGIDAATEMFYDGGHSIIAVVRMYVWIDTRENITKIVIKMPTDMQTPEKYPAIASSHSLRSHVHFTLSFLSFNSLNLPPTLSVFLI